MFRRISREPGGEPRERQPRPVEHDPGQLRNTRRTLTVGDDRQSAAPRRFGRVFPAVGLLAPDRDEQITRTKASGVVLDAEDVGVRARRAADLRPRESCQELHQLHGKGARELVSSRGRPGRLVGGAISDRYSVWISPA